MTTWFYAGQEDYITKLNDLAAIAELIAGPKGWTPELAVVSDGNRRVLQVADWFDGEGTKPATGEYVGSTGLVSDISLAIDIRGPQGIQGEQGVQGIQGEQGVQGIQGEQGEKGDTGDTGPANNLEIGTVTSGVTAYATITGTSPNQTLNLVLPQGPQGDPGTDGSDGADGSAATITVGTVTTGAPGTSATVTNVGTSSAAVFDITIPRGDPGAGSGDVASVNGVMPDGGGNVELEPNDIGAVEEAPSDTKTYGRKDGNWVEVETEPADWNTLTNKPAVIAAGATMADARAEIGAGTSNFSGDYDDLSDKPTLGTSAALNVASSGDAAAGEVVKGNDTRLTNFRTPTGVAGGVLSGTYPNPGFAVDMATQAELNAVEESKLNKGYATHTDTAGDSGITWPALQFLVQKFTAAVSIAGAIRFAGIRRYEFDSSQNNSGGGHHVGGLDWYVHKGSGNPNIAIGHEAKVDVETAATISVVAATESQVSSNAGTIGNLYGHRAQITGNAGTIGTFVGYRPDVTSSSGTLGEVIGLEFPDLSAFSATQRSALVNRDPGAPILSAAPIIDQSLTYAAPSATGFTVTIPDKRQMLLLTPAAAYAAGTINFPAKSGVADGQFVEITTSQAVTAVTWGANGASYVLYGPAGLAAGQTVRFRYFAALDWWVFVNGDAPATDLAGKQDTLVAGTNIKTINGESPLGVGDLSVSGVPTGSVIFSVSELETPDFLPCNGLLALTSSYPTLSDLINAPVLADTLTSVSTLNSFGSNRMCVSKDGLSVYTVSSTSPYLRGAAINASTGALTSYSNPSGLTNGISNNEVFTNEDGTLVLCHSSSDVYIYQRSGSTLTSYTSLSISNINAVTTDESLTYIAVAHSSGIRVFKRTGATLNELTLPSSVSGSNNNAVINFTGNGKFLLMCRTTATRFNYCVRNGDTFSELTAAPTQPSAGLQQICSSYTGNVILGHDGATNTNKIWLAASGDQLLPMNSPPTITTNSNNYVKISRSGNLISLPLASSPWATVLKWDGIAWSSNLITSAIGSAISRSVTPVREGVTILVNNNSGNTQTIRNTSSYDHTSQFPLPTQAGKATGVVTTQAYIKT